jgi:hypothetical protein
VRGDFGTLIETHLGEIWSASGNALCNYAKMPQMILLTSLLRSVILSCLEKKEGKEKVILTKELRKKGLVKKGLLCH